MATDRITKLDRLKALLRGYGRLAVAFSGGVDSTFLLATAVEALGAHAVLALTAQAPNFPAAEDSFAARFCAERDVEQVLVPVKLLELDGFTDNSPERCYHCKTEILSKLGAAATDLGFTIIADGGNVDDLGDYRPGLKAVREAGVVSPLAEAGFSKGEVRASLKEMGVEIWDKPAAACLASRVPYGTSITGDILTRVEAAESFLAGLGFIGVRVRHHGDLARIEVQGDDRVRLFDPAVNGPIAARLKELGYDFIAVDLQGYRTGSLNESIRK